MSSTTKKRARMQRRAAPPGKDANSFSAGYDAAIADVIKRVKENREQAHHFEATWALGELQGELEEVQ
jgi:hypothetical protein